MNSVIEPIAYRQEDVKRVFNDRPFFSILLPTRDRSEILADAISSVLTQDFENFELVIANNDSNSWPEYNTPSCEMADAFDDPRVKIIRTGGLSMWDNWEACFNASVGRYVLMIEDKMRLMPGALTLLNEQLTLYSERCISYQVLFTKKPNINYTPLRTDSKSWLASDVLKLFTNFELSAFTHMPAVLNSVCKREILADIQKRTGRLFSWASPDYVAAFKTLNSIEKLRHLPLDLAYIPNNWMYSGNYSTCKSSYTQDGLSAEHNKKMPIDLESFFNSAAGMFPIPTQKLWINSVLSDGFMYVPQLGKTLKPSKSRYLGFCLYICVLGWKSGANMSEAAKLVRSKMTFRAYLHFFKLLTQSAIRTIRSL